jgi:hypothetical protein
VKPHHSGYVARVRTTSALGAHPGPAGEGAAYPGHVARVVARPRHPPLGGGWF